MTDRTADRLVAFAGGVFKPSSIQDTDLTMQVINQPPLLKSARSQSDAAAGNSEDLSHIVMRESYCIGEYAIQRHQQPSRQALICIMKLTVTASR